VTDSHGRELEGTLKVQNTLGGDVDSTKSCQR
jgi:hypothetical protein